MNGRGREIKRIVVALDGSRHSLAALEAAVELATRRRASLRAVFVEDERWRKVAGHPAARVVSRDETSTPDVESLEREVKLLALRMERRVNEAARTIRADFSIVRGDVSKELLAACSGADVVVLGRQGQAPARAVGKTATRVALELTLPVLLIREGDSLAAPVLFLEDTPAQDRAIDALATLAVQDGGRATIIAVAPHLEERARLLEHAHLRLAPLGLVLDLRHASTFEAALAEVLHRRGTPIVLAPGGAVATTEDLTSVVARAPGAVIVA